MAEIEQAARELRWLLLSPPLLDPSAGVHPAVIQCFDAAERVAIDAWLAGIDRDPAALVAFIQRPASERTGLPGRGASLRLGRRAERLMAFFLLHGPTHRLVAANIPLRRAAPQGDRTTLGEIDFLLRDAQGRGWHWELAVKFFLCTVSGAQARASDFVGPDGAETFDTKLRKLFDRQLRHAPPAPWDADTWTPAACARGRLFYRWGEPVPRVAGLHPQHLQGRWIERSRLLELPDAQAPSWQVVPRNDWMCPRQTESDAGVDLISLARQLDEAPQRLATLIHRIGREPGRDDGREEADLPLFVVNPV